MITTATQANQAPALAFDVGIDWARRQVTATGPLDSTTAALFVEAIRVLRRSSHGPITVDLRGVSRLTAAGMLALDEACSHQNWSGTTLALKVTD